MDDDDDQVTPPRKHKRPNLVDVELAKKQKETQVVKDRVPFKYCGKSYCSSKRLTQHINEEHTGSQTIYACLYCSQSFNQYIVYIEHLKEHSDKVVRCSVNFSTPPELQDHIEASHKEETVER